MSIWLNPKGETYAGTGQNAWLKKYADRLTDSLKQEVDANLSLHFAGTGHRHRAEDIDFDQTTVKSALDTETETRAKADAALETALLGEAAARETANNNILTEVRSLNLKNGGSSGSLRSTGSSGDAGEDAIQLGKDCEATGPRSHAQNYGTVAASPCQSARGRFNEKDDKGSYVDIVGNGTSDTERSNAYTLDWEGNGHFAGNVYVGEGKEKLAIANASLPGMTNYQGEIDIGSFGLYKEDASSFQEDVDFILERVASLTQDIDPTKTSMCVIRGNCTYYVIEDVLEGGIYLVENEGNSFPVYGWVYWRPDNGPDNGENGSVYIRNSVILFQDILDGEAIFHYSRTGTYTAGDTWEQSGVWGDWEKDSYRGLVSRKEHAGTIAEIKTDLNGKLDKDTMVTEAANNTLVLEENQDARLGETSSLVLSMPENLGDWYRSTFSFQSGENATSLVYGYTPLDWKGDDVTSDGRFVPEPFSTYEVDVKNLGINGVRARVDKIAGYTSADVEGTVLALPSSAGKALRDYKIYGNSEQDGTPSTETSVAIQSVGDYNEDTGKYDVPIVLHYKNWWHCPDSAVLHPSVTYEKDSQTFTIKGAGVQQFFYQFPMPIPAGTTCAVTLKMLAGEMAKGVLSVGGFHRGASDSHQCVVQTKEGSSYVINESLAGRTFTSVSTATDTITHLMIYIDGSYVVSEPPQFQVQFEIGDTPTDYEPYIEPVTTTVSLDAPLRKVGEAADYMDYKTGMVNYRVAECVLTGNESWAYVVDGDYFKLALSREANTSAMESSLCSHYVYGDATLDQSFWIDGTEQALCIKDTRFTNEDELKIWLQSEEVRIIYPTLLAMGALVKLPVIDTNLYDNVISIGTSVQPSNV
ncbi:MAG: hypothetical protein U0L92_05270, partial [Clostridia bacterium]|nr:hypothetical protein [Clostridia bacterium]